MSLTRKHVIWAYRLFLEREPESEQAIDEKLRAVATISELRIQFLGSPEYLNRIGSFASSSRQNIVIKEFGGCRLFADLCDTHVGLNIINGVYEPDELEFVRSTVRKGQIAIDVGANIGVFTVVLAATVGGSGHVYAFEPLPRNASLLIRTIIENKFQDRVTLEQLAVGAQPGEMQLISAVITDNWGGAYLQEGSAVPAGHEARTVRVITLDGYPLHRPVDFLKLDAEGAEMMVLRGARTLLRVDTPIVLAELNPKQLRAVSGCSSNDVIGEMKHHGYKCYRLEQGGRRVPLIEHVNDGLINVVFMKCSD